MEDRSSLPRTEKLNSTHEHEASLALKTVKLAATSRVKYRWMYFDVTDKEPAVEHGYTLCLKKFEFLIFQGSVATCPR